MQTNLRLHMEWEKRIALVMPKWDKAIPSEVVSTRANRTSPDKRAGKPSSWNIWFSNEFTITSAMWKCNSLMVPMERMLLCKGEKKKKPTCTQAEYLSGSIPASGCYKAQNGFHRQVVTHSHNELLNHRYSHIKGGSIVSRCCRKSRMWSIRRGIFLQWC